MSQQEPRRGGLPPTDLGGAFARGSGLQARLGPGRARRQDETDPETPGPESTPQEQPEPTNAVETTHQPQRADNGGDDDDAQPTSEATSTAAADGHGARDRRGAVVIYTSTALRARITDYLDRTNARNADLLFDAFEATADELPQLWADSLRGPQTKGRSLFDRGSAPVRAGTEPQVGWYVAMSPANQAVLDDVVRQVTGGSNRKRTTLAVMALTTFLDRWEKES